MKGSLLRAHGLGNDYLAADSGELPFVLAAGTVRQLCDRHTGLGSDGLVVRVATLEGADYAIRIFNPDGSEAEKSGNGLRVFAAFLLARGWVEPGREFSVETLSGVVRIEITTSPADGVLDVRVEMGTASFRSIDAGMKGPDRDATGEMLELEAGDRVTINPVSLGNPHCVIFEDVVAEADLRRRAPQISVHPSFQRGTNVQFARLIGPDTIEAWVYERGAGETLASGSSACAVAAAAVRRGLVSDHRVQVVMPGGTLQVDVADDWALTLRGPVETVAWVKLAGGLLGRLRGES